MRAKRLMFWLFCAFGIVAILIPFGAYKIACNLAYRKIESDVNNDLKAVVLDTYCTSNSTRDSILGKNRGFLNSSPKRSIWNTFVMRDFEDYKSNNIGLYVNVGRWYAFKAQEREGRWTMTYWHIFTALMGINLENNFTKDEIISLECFCKKKHYDERLKIMKLSVD